MVPSAACRVGVSILVVLGVGLSSVEGQHPRRPPEPGQPGKDVVWVPTPDRLVEKMLDLAAVSPDDFVIDLGSGDGRTVIAAARRGARAHGIEYNADLVALSIDAARRAGVADRATFEAADLFATDFSRATVVTMFLLPELNLKLRPTLLGLRPGTRIVSNTFRFGSWQPDGAVELGGGCSSWCQAYLWVVPAPVAGAWSLGQATLTFRQEFQTASGTMVDRGTERPVQGARIRGDAITFTVGDAVYTGKVFGHHHMSGSVKTGEKTTTWNANR